MNRRRRPPERFPRRGRTAQVDTAATGRSDQAVARLVLRSRRTRPILTLNEAAADYRVRAPPAIEMDRADGGNHRPE